MKEFTSYIENYEKKEINFYNQIWREIRVYLTGKRIEAQCLNNNFFVGNVPVLWELRPTGHDDFIIHMQNAPCFVHRWTQRLVLGFKYKRTKEKA